MKKIFFSFIFVLLVGLLTTSQSWAKPAEGPGDEYLEFEPPQECFMIWFGPESSAVGETSCGKKLTRFQIDQINMNLQESAKILEYAREAANEAGFNLFPGAKLDLTAEMQAKADEHMGDDPQFQGVGDFTFVIKKFQLERGQDKTIEGETYQVFKVDAIMQETFAGQTMTDTMQTITAVTDPDSTSENITRILEFKGSFGGMDSFQLNGRVVTVKATGAAVSTNINFTMSGEGTSMECTDPSDPDTCADNPNVTSGFEQTIALQQVFSDGADSGKMVWTESGSGGSVEEGSELQENSFNNTLTAGWDGTGAGCLEMEMDFNSQFEAGSGSGGAGCGPFADGTDKCEAYKKGRKFAAILMVEDDGEEFADCDPETGQCAGGFECANPDKTNNCNGYCPNGSSGTPPDPEVAANNTEGQAWEMGCWEGLYFEEGGIEVGFGSSPRKGECWDANGLVATTSNEYDFAHRDERIDPTYDHRDNFSNDDDVVYEDHGTECAMTFDDAKKVELKPDGSEFCVPDYYANSNSAQASTPLCSAIDHSVNPCE